MNTKLFTRSEKANENYLTKIIRIDNVRPHPDPKVTRLDITTILGNDIIVGRGSIEIGDIVVYCPCESTLNMEFLRENNQFRDIAMNKVHDKNETGFFENKGRVKAINLQKIISTGFVFPINWLKIWQPNLDLRNIADYVDIAFDTVNDQLFSKKYVIHQTRQPNLGTSKNVRRNNRLKRFDKLIENQFSFHYDTARLADNMFKIDPDDIVSITTKYHGTSLIVSDVLVNRNLKWPEMLLQFFGARIVANEYDVLYSSRGVIKNRYINKDVGSGFYSVDVWTAAGERLKPFLEKGMTIYAEICGFLPGSDKYIQKNHDYKCKSGEFEIYVYRITYTNQDGIVFEFSAKQVQNWCKERNIRPVKELYYGKAKDVYPELSIEEHWHTNFVDKLSKDKNRFYMEVNSPDCFNDVPHEGIVIRNDSTGAPALKLKTKSHFLMETIELDNGEADIESIEEVNADTEE